MTFTPKQGGSGRFQVVSYPAALPNKCCLCGYALSGSSNDRWWLDIGVNIDYYGALYFCSVCFTQGASELGYIDPDVVEALRDVESERMATINKLEGQNVALRSAINALTGSGHFSESVSLDDVSVTDETSQGSDSRSETAIVGVKRSDTKAAKSADVERSDDLSTTSSIDTSLNI